MALVISFVILWVLVVILIMSLMNDRRLNKAKPNDGKMTGYWTGAERRASVRVKTALQAAYAVDKASNHENETVSKNISLGGILMLLYEKLHPATLLALDIFIPGSKSPIMAKGEVVWIKELSGLDEIGRRMFDAGIKFVSMAPADKEKLDREIKNLAKTRHG
ncbi:MAG: PilZ domain-containing protein [Candidatus Omnitrophota bacterium]